MKKYERYEPEDFELETTSVWSFPERGCWATHNSSYRGNKAKVLIQKSIWGEINMFVWGNKAISMASFFDDKETGYALDNREKYKVREYKKFALFCAELSGACMLGINKERILEICE